MMGSVSEQLWSWPPQGPRQVEQKTVWQVGQGTEVGTPSVVLGLRLHTAWHSRTGHQALLGSSFTPERDTDRHTHTQLFLKTGKTHKKNKDFTLFPLAIDEYALLFI